MLGRQVAIKILPEEFARDADRVSRFRREAQLLASLNHPNIITVYEVGQHEDRPYIAMAHVDGLPLSEVIAQGQMSIDEAIGIAEQICEGLEHVGMSRCDVKTNKILAQEIGRAHV